MSQNPLFRVVFALLLAFAAPLAGQTRPPSTETAPRPLEVGDLFQLRDVRDPRVSPEGDWVAFAVRSLDAEADRADTDLYMVPFAGGESVRLTAGDQPESSPRFSPDGRWIAFLSAREGDHAQVWLLDRRGGEAVKATDFKAGVSDLAWSPDGKRLALVVSDVDPEEDGSGEGEPEAPRPLVVRRLQFKRDGAGFLRDLREHVYVFDLETKESVQVTSGPWDDAEPAWSPDGRLLAFVSNRTPEPDANDNTDLFVVAPRAGEAPRKLTTWEGADGSPVWSPDGRFLAYVAGGDPRDVWYDTSHVAVVPVAGGPSRPLTDFLDRNAYAPRFSPDGRSVYFLLEDGGNVHLARVPVEGGGSVERVVAGEREVEGYDVGASGRIAVLETTFHRPGELSAVEEGQAPGGAALRRLSRVNDAFLAGVRLGEVRRFQATHPDGQKIDAFLTLPPGYDGGRLPALLRIHGGPVAQYTTGFQTEWQMLAAQGYAVIGANPRGSSGYGREFSRAIFADWGAKDFDDVMAVVDEAVRLGVADPERLGVGGWSYGGILTNYVITKTGRFKAAISGASEVNYLANYGTDHYQKEWEAELGLPWENTDLWVRLSPFFQVEKVTTPTLILCGEQDWNVPLLNSEQLYQALRRLGRVETELVVYPGQNHGIRRPSYQKDRLERYIGWYDRFVKGGLTPGPSPTPPPLPPGEG
jgi:dipeptidyl aminopeptidase/acylaminoacyl peptidase